jgi:hypothetical protein
MQRKEIEVKFQELPENLKIQVLNYIDSLLKKHKNQKPGSEKFKFDWEGGLSDLKKEFTSVELQHKSLEWR